MFLLRRALGLGPRPVPERTPEPATEHDEFADDPSTDLGDDDTQEVSRDHAHPR